MENLIKLNNAEQITALTKTELEALALDLQTSLIPIDEFVSLYKLKYLIENRMRFIKDKAIADSFNCTIGNVEIKNKNENDYTFSPEVDKLEEQKKQIGKQITAQKNLEKTNGVAILKSESNNIAIYLKD
jgi:hypothetical protein